jgi:hypothetical protein
MVGNRDGKRWEVYLKEIGRKSVCLAQEHTFNLKCF